MALFDMFRGDSGVQMTPHLGFTISLIYMIAADGVIEETEIGHLLSVIGGSEEGGVIGVGGNNKKLLDQALKYVKKHSPEQFLSEHANVFTDAQRMCVLTNLCDSLLSDGSAAPQEQALFAKFLQAFGVSEDRFRPFFEVIVLKNDRSVFSKQDHPRNRPGHTVSLSKH